VDKIRILFIGDIFGRPGRTAIYKHLPTIKADEEIDVCIANCENASGGKGLAKDAAHHLYEAGVDAITLGNHAWDNKQIFDFIDRDNRIVRAFNYPADVPGRGLIIIEVGDGIKIGVSQLMCRLFMNPTDCPFQKSNELINLMSDCHVTFIDVHGEATSEKQSLGWHLDGKISALIGTHTHVPTADERILPNGTAYQTDAGMSGAYDSVIGMDIETATHNFMSPIRAPFKIAKDNVIINGVIIDVDVHTGKALSIKRYSKPA
jgi:metallophosphoesterase (TIGR00282 family)